MTAEQITRLIENKRQLYITKREALHIKRQKQGKENEPPTKGMKTLSIKVGLLTKLLNEIQ